MRRMFPDVGETSKSTMSQSLVGSTRPFAREPKFEEVDVLGTQSSVAAPFELKQ
jgi:hypothetical protein